jgi:hypothetical protein
MPEWMVESSQLSDVGQKRKHNEDYVGFYEPFRIADQKPTVGCTCWLTG